MTAIQQPHTPAVAEVPVVARDGARSRAVVAYGRRAGRPALVCLPAMGVRARYYEPFALNLAQRGYDVLVAENRGTGSSEVRPGRRLDFGYQRMIADDLPAAFDKARALFGGKPLHVVGHSLGGQLAALHLASRPGAFEGLVLVASGSVDFRAFTGLESLRVLGGTQAAALLAGLIGYFPGDRIGFGGRQPKTVIRDWAHQGRTGRYRLGGTDYDYEAALATVTAPVLALSIAGDPLAPESARDHLCAKMPAARIQRETVAIKPGRGNAHFRWVRDPGPLIDRLDDYLQSPIGGRLG